MAVVDLKYTEEFGPHLTPFATSGYKMAVHGTPLAEAIRLRAAAQEEEDP